MLGATDNGIEYIKSNPFIPERTLTIRVNQEDIDSKPLVIDLPDSSKDKISADELDDIEEEEEGEGNEEHLGMPEDQDDSDPGIMPITNNTPPSHSPG